MTVFDGAGTSRASMPHALLHFFVYSAASQHRKTASLAQLAIYLAQLTVTKMSDYGDDLEYLSPTFDPSSLTVPRLRSILVAHEVNYPSSAKKGDLIEIFNTNVVPKARRLLSARSRVKRSARGIEDVPSSVEPSVQGDEDSELEDDMDRLKVASPPGTVRRTSSRRTPRASKIEALDGTTEQEIPAPRTVNRTSSVRQSRRSDGESANERATIRSPTRSTRKIIATPAVKREEDKEEQLRTSRLAGNDSPFTAENPFQSGTNSPNSGSRAVSGERRRTTAGTTSSKSEVKRSSSSRRKTDFATSTSGSNGTALTSTKKTPQSTPALKRRYQEEPEADLETSAGEEFTPEETAELALNQDVHNSLTAHRPKRRRSSGPRNPMFKVAPWAISLALLSGIGTVYRREKLDIGFCGVGRSATNTLGGVQVPDWADILLPKCEPCPPHAYCYSQLRVTCEPDFVLVPHPLNLGGLVPLPPSCEPDGEKAMKVKAVADRAVDELRERNALWECGELRDANGNKKKALPQLKEPDLKKIVASKRRRTMSDEEFEELWVGAIGEITARDEIENGVDE